MKKFMYMLIFTFLLLATTMTVLAEETDAVTLDLKNRAIDTSHEHIFKPEDYTADGNATCKADGTKSARCSASEDCGEFDIIPDVGSKKHILETGICPSCGLHGTTLQQGEINWLKYEKNGSTSWFGIDNRNNQFEEGSHMWIEWLSSDDEDIYNTYWDQLDVKHKSNIEADNYKMFQIGVTKKDGTEYTILDKDKPALLYVQIPDNWDKEELKAAFISSGTDEAVALDVSKSMDYTEGKAQFAVITMEHFSPYIIYDECTQDERQGVAAPSVGSDNTTTSPKTGDVNLVPMVVLFVFSCAVVVYTAKRSYRKNYR